MSKNGFDALDEEIDRLRADKREYLNVIQELQDLRRGMTERLKDAEECLRLLLSHLQVTDTRTMAGTIRPAMKVKLAHSIDAAVDYEKASAYFDRHKEE